MRYFQIPETLEVKPTPEVIGSNPNAKPEPLPFKKYAFTFWLNDSRAIEGGFLKQVRWAKVIEIFEKAAPGDVVQLEDEDFAALKAIVEAPRMFLPPMVAVQLLAYSRAVLEASDKAPVTAVAAPA